VGMTTNYHIITYEGTGGRGRGGAEKGPNLIRVDDQCPRGKGSGGRGLYQFEIQGGGKGRRTRKKGEWTNRFRS